MTSATQLKEHIDIHTYAQTNPTLRMVKQLLDKAHHWDSSSTGAGALKRPAPAPDFSILSQLFLW